MKFLYPLLLLVPLALVLEFANIGGDPLLFVISGLALVPLAAVLGQATETVAVYTGPRIGALLNATFGNAAELIITIVALREGLVVVVKASIAGSIIGNILIVLGASALLGGLKHGTQRFDAQHAGTNASLMALAVVALVIPAVFALGEPQHRPTDHDIERLSEGVAVVLIIVYALYLVFSLRGGHTPDTTIGEEEAEHEVSGWASSLPVALGLLAGSTIAIVVLSEILVGVIEPTAEAWGLSDLFVGVLLVPLVGNVAEHLVAVQAAYKNQMDLSLGIAVGSGLQIALFVTPVLVFTGVLLGNELTLVFNSFELAALAAATVIAVLISVDGESNWLEGVMLIAVYAIIGVAFFFVP